MKTKAILEGILVAVISAILSYNILISPATMTAIAIRRKMPGAWFAGLIVWYAMFVVIGLSTVIAGIAFRLIHKRAAGASPNS